MRHCERHKEGFGNVVQSEQDLSATTLALLNYSRFLICVWEDYQSGQSQFSALDRGSERPFEAGRVADPRWYKLSTRRLRRTPSRDTETLLRFRLAPCVSRLCHKVRHNALSIVRSVEQALPTRRLCCPTRHRYDRALQERRCFHQRFVWP